MEDVQQERVVEVQSTYTIKLLRNAFVLCIALTAGYLHYWYVQEIHENTTHFSHLSDLEREMLFESEMGFYYSYYKTVVEERPFAAGISRIMYDRLVEYPNEVNAFNRFNIHPEVFLGAVYRYLEPYVNSSRECRTVSRGELPPARSCVGLGTPVAAYLQAIWALAGLMVGVIVMHAYALSGSVAGGVLAAAQYFANHAHSTRVQWAPNQRENFAAPLLMLQMLLVTCQLRARRAAGTRLQLQVIIVILNCLCLLFWQLSQFILLTQIAIFFVMEQMCIISLKSLCVLLHSHFCGLHMAVLLLQGNDMLKSSLYTSFFLLLSTYCLFFYSLRIKVRTKFDLFLETLLVILRIVLLASVSFYYKEVISDFLGVKEDNHIWEMLYAKFTNYKSFHTMIYTCTEVFDFLPLSYVKDLTATCLIPLTVYAIIKVCISWLAIGLLSVHHRVKCSDPKLKSCIDKMAAANEENGGGNLKKESESDTDDSGIENDPRATIAHCNVRRLSFSRIDFVFSKFREHMRKRQRTKRKKIDETDDTFIYLLKSMNIDAAIFYNISQLVVFGVMAYLFMRLKLLFSTQMCIVSSLCASAMIGVNLPSKLKTVTASCVFAVLVRHLYENVSKELSQLGEFSDPQKEQLLTWIGRETPAGAVFAGSLPVLAAVLLSARRAVVAHPHYEHQHARERAYAVYKTYGRFSPYELYEELSKLKASVLIVETNKCYGRSSKGCTYADIWDVEYPSRASQPLLCHTLLTETTDHFYRLFQNDHYAVFRIHDLSVRYMPRQFDS